MIDDDTDPMRIPCLCNTGAEGNLIPNERCELHWHRVINGGDAPPAWAFP